VKTSGPVESRREGSRGKQSQGSGGSVYSEGGKEIALQERFSNANGLTAMLLGAICVISSPFLE